MASQTPRRIGRTPSQYIDSALWAYYAVLRTSHYPDSPQDTIQSLWNCIKHSLDTFDQERKKRPFSLEDKKYIFTALETMICNGAPLIDDVKKMDQDLAEFARKNQQSEDPSLRITSIRFIYAPPNETTPGSSDVPSGQNNNTARISGSRMMTLGEILEVCIKDNKENNPYILWPNISHRRNTTHFDPKTMGWVESDFRKLIEAFDVLRGKLESQPTL
jgi:hypothetical protein